MVENKCRELYVDQVINDHSKTIIGWLKIYSEKHTQTIREDICMLLGMCLASFGHF